jgi:hydroxyacylglutathione hydrolase
MAPPASTGAASASGAGDGAGSPGDTGLILESFSVGALGCNCTLAVCPETHEALVVDPGGDAPRIVERLRALGAQAVTLVHTHAHFDHVLGTEEVARATRAEAALHADDRWLFDNVALQAELFGLRVQTPSAIASTAQPWRILHGGEALRFGRREARILHTPGHTPGSLCVYLEHAAEQPLLLSGDTLFAGSVGRTDLWGGSFEHLARSIRGPLFALPEHTRVIPGHGPETTIGLERRDNPFVGDHARV